MIRQDFTPRPNTTRASALGANHGLRRAMPFVCALPVGWGMMLGLCGLGARGATVDAGPPVYY